MRASLVALLLVSPALFGEEAKKEAPEAPRRNVLIELYTSQG